MTSATIGNSAYQSLSNQQLSEIDEFCDRFDLELAKGDGRSIESFLAEAPEESHGGLLAELLAMEQVTLLPHIGSATRETRGEMSQLLLDNLDAHFNGRPLLTAVV